MVTLYRKLLSKVIDIDTVDIVNVPVNDTLNDNDLLNDTLNDPLNYNDLLNESLNKLLNRRQKSL